MNTPSANAITTAEHTIALLLSLARNTTAFLSMKEKMKDLVFKDELFGKTFGLELGNVSDL